MGKGGVLSSGKKKRTGCDGENSLLSAAEDVNEWNYTSAPHKGIHVVNRRKIIFFTFTGLSTRVIGNRTRDLPAGSAVPQPNAPPRNPFETAVE